MTSLYGRLFKYRETRGRTPLEDYLSECLADLFNRLSSDIQASLVEDLFIPRSERQKWISYRPQIKRLRMETQYPIGVGRLDILLIADGCPVLAIENKISAPIRKISESDDQLKTYGNWLEHSKQSGTPTVICLLTHTTKAPLRFIEGSTGEYGSAPKVTRWGAVARYIQALSRTENIQADARSLLIELAAFLEENGMTGEYAGREEFAAAILYLKAGARVSYTFESIFDHLGTLGGCFVKGAVVHDMPLHFDTEKNLIWGWKYLATKTNKNVYFGYGISLSPRRHFRGALVPDRDSVFLCVGAEGKREVPLLELAAREVEQPWGLAYLPNESVVITFRDLETVMNAPTDLAPRMIEWVDEVQKDVKAFVAGFDRSSVK